MGAVDLATLPLYVMFIAFCTLWYRSKITDPLLGQYFLLTVFFKILGAVSMVCIYRFYYEYGDTLSYYAGCKLLTNNIGDHPGTVFKIIFSMPTSFDQEIYSFLGPLRDSVAFRTNSNFMVVKFGALFNTIGLNSILVTNIFFAFFSSFGIWKLYLTFHERYPHLHRKLAFSILFVPSLFFWGSGLLKDTISLCFLGFLFYYFNKMLYSRVTFMRLVYFVFSVYVVLIVKSYIIFSLIPPIIFLIYMRTHRSIRSKALRLLSVPFLISVALVSFYVVLTTATSLDEKYAVENVLKTAENTKNDILYNSSEGAGYSLGEVEYTPLGLLSVMPSAINVTLFRPYLHEVRNPIMLLSALENTVILWMFITVMMKIRRNIGMIWKDEVLMFSLIYALFFAFAVGFSTYNFGTLVRYKIPCIPFFITFLTVVKYDYQAEDNNA